MKRLQRQQVLKRELNQRKLDKLLSFTIENAIKYEKAWLYLDLPKFIFEKRVRELMRHSYLRRKQLENAYTTDTANTTD